MKKRTFWFLLLVAFFTFHLSVYAETYEKNQLIPVDTVATVNTDKFNYNGFTYSSKVDSKGNSLLSFTSIQNNTMSKTAVSINMLLFGEDKKNIGFLTYCTDKDVSSNYAGFKLSGGQSAPFSINVTSRYFAEGYSAKDVEYVAVMDENRYCQIGGYDKYAGQTIDQIVNGISPSTTNQSMEKFSFLQDRSVQTTILIVVVAITALIVFGLILNALHKKIYGKTTGLAYLPITNFYICTKLAFGKIVAIVFIVLYIASGVLYGMGISFLFALLSIMETLAFLLVLAKLITKKYDLFYFEPAMQTPQNSNINTTSTYENSSTEEESKGQAALDLSYENTSFEDTPTDIFDVSAGEMVSEPEAELESSNTEDTTSSSNDTGESDLTKFFH